MKLSTPGIFFVGMLFAKEIKLWGQYLQIYIHIVDKCMFLFNLLYIIVFI